MVKITFPPFWHLMWSLTEVLDEYLHDYIYCATSTWLFDWIIERVHTFREAKWWKRLCWCRTPPIWYSILSSNNCLYGVSYILPVSTWVSSDIFTIYRNHYFLGNLRNIWPHQLPDKKKITDCILFFFEILLHNASSYYNHHYPNLPTEAVIVFSLNLH